VHEVGAWALLVAAFSSPRYSNSMVGFSSPSLLLRNSWPPALALTGQGPRYRILACTWAAGQGTPFGKFLELVLIGLQEHNPRFARAISLVTQNPAHTSWIGRRECLRFPLQGAACSVPSHTWDRRWTNMCARTERAAGLLALRQDTGRLEHQKDLQIKMDVV